MEVIEYTDPVTQRKYRALKDGEHQIILGPPEGLVDDFGLPEPTATNLHNVLYRRGIFNYAQATKGNALIGALQEALLIDAQRLAEVYLKYEKEEVVP